MKVAVGQSGAKTFDPDGRLKTKGLRDFQKKFLCH
jgi:hypothetical protein